MPEITNIPKTAVIRQAQKPSNPEPGLLWYDTKAGVLKQYKNGSFTGVTPEVANLRTSILEIVSDIDENRYKNNLAIQNYDDVIFDTFVDNSKISSKTDISLSSGIEGSISLGVLNQFNQSQNLDTSGGTSSGSDNIGIGIKPDTDLNGVIIEFDANMGVYDDLVLYEKSTGNKITSHGSSVNGGDQILLEASLSSGTEYNAILQTSSSTTYVGGSSPSGTNLDMGDLVVKGSNGSATAKPTDNLSNTYYYNFTKVGTPSNASNGNLESTSKDLGFTPSKVIVNQELTSPTTNSDDVEYTIIDGNGNTDTISQNNIGSEITLSNINTGSGVSVKIDIRNDYSGSINEYGVLFV